MEALQREIDELQAKNVKLEAQRDEYIRIGDRDREIAIDGRIADNTNAIAAKHNALTAQQAAQQGMFPPPVSVVYPHSLR